LNVQSLLPQSVIGLNVLLIVTCVALHVLMRSSPFAMGLCGILILWWLCFLRIRFSVNLLCSQSMFCSHYVWSYMLFVLDFELFNLILGYFWWNVRDVGFFTDFCPVYNALLFMIDMLTIYWIIQPLQQAGLHCPDPSFLCWSHCASSHLLGGLYVGIWNKALDMLLVFQQLIGPGSVYHPLFVYQWHCCVLWAAWFFWLIWVTPSGW
jgi:hypothetical protein